MDGSRGAGLNLTRRKSKLPLPSLYHQGYQLERSKIITDSLTPDDSLCVCVCVCEGNLSLTCPRYSENLSPSFSFFFISFSLSAMSFASGSEQPIRHSLLVKFGALEVIKSSQIHLPLFRQSFRQGAGEAIANTIGGESLATPVDD